MKKFRKIECACGHKEEIYCYENQVSYYEERECKACYREQENKAAKQFSKENNLPALQGKSKKQVEYAESVRAKAYAFALETIQCTIEYLDSVKNQEGINFMAQLDASKRLIENKQLIAYLKEETRASEVLDTDVTCFEIDRLSKESFETLLPYLTREQVILLQGKIAGASQEIIDLVASYATKEVEVEEVEVEKVEAKKTSKREIFKRAWKSAKQAAERFGGSSKEYFAACLSQAWRVNHA